MSARWRNGYGRDEPVWIEREHDGWVYRAWVRASGGWAGRVLRADVAWHWPRHEHSDTAGDWQCATRDEMERVIEQAVRARRRLTDVISDKGISIRMIRAYDVQSDWTQERW